MTFVDGLGVGDIGDVALRDRRHLSEDGVLIIVATLAGQNGARRRPPELIARGFAESGPLLDEMRERGGDGPARLPRRRHRSRSSSSRSTCTTASASSSTTGRSAGR